MNEMQIMEYNNIRVITTKQVAEAYGTETKQISQGFNRNKSKFTEGKHFFKLTGDELRTFRLKADLPKNVGKLYLWTDRGALLMAKIIDTDTAWDAYERLVDFYFEKKTEQALSVTKSSEPCLIPTKSTTPVPKRSDWYRNNRERIKSICDKLNISHKELYHQILKFIGASYDISAANEIYHRERGFYPEYAIDIVGYFPELEKCADKFLARVSRVIAEK